MADYPALPLWTDAYLADTMHLSATESGAYLHLLMAAWRTPTCSIPVDDRKLARMAKCAPREWKRVRDVVMAFWVIDEKTKTATQKRLLTERIRVTEKSKEQSRKANLKWLKDKQTGHAAADAEVMPDECPDDASISISIEDSIATAIEGPLSPLLSPSVAKEQKLPKQRKGSRLPDDWQPTDENRRMARAKGLGYQETEIEFGKFKAYYTQGPGRNKSWSDWDRALGNWLDNVERPAARGAEKPRKVDAMMEGIFNAVSGSRSGAGGDAGPPLVALPEPGLFPGALAGTDGGLRRVAAHVSVGGGGGGDQGVPAEAEISADDF